MTEEEKTALIDALDLLWQCSDCHPQAARRLVKLREVLNLPAMEYDSNTGRIRKLEKPHAH